MVCNELCNAYIGLTSGNSVNMLLFFIKTPVQIKEFGAVSKVDFSPQPPYNYAVTASSRVSIILNFFIFLLYSLLLILSHLVKYCLSSCRFTFMADTPKNL